MFYMLYLQRHLDWFLKFLGHWSRETKADPTNLWDLQQTLGKPWLEELHSRCDQKKSRNRDTKIRPWRHGRMARAWTPESWAWTAAASWIFWTTSCSKKPLRIQVCPVRIREYPYISMTQGWDWNPQACPRWIIVMELLWQIRVLPFTAFFEMYNQKKS